MWRRCRCLLHFPGGCIGSALAALKTRWSSSSGFNHPQKGNLIFKVNFQHGHPHKRTELAELQLWFGVSKILGAFLPVPLELELQVHLTWATKQLLGDNNLHCWLKPKWFLLWYNVLSALYLYKWQVTALYLKGNSWKRASAEEACLEVVWAP